MITYGTNPGLGIAINGQIPAADSIPDEGERKNIIKALQYMGLEAGKPLLGMPVQHVFIGSCTNSRIEDLRQVAALIKGRKKNEHVQVMIVPGSQQVAKQVQAEGLDKVFAEAGFEIRQAGCSACLGMNEDKIPAGEYCISTSQNTSRQPPHRSSSSHYRRGNRCKRNDGKLINKIGQQPIAKSQQLQ
jgi:3-isopropylmalate/(R)-2-methylmalate dehydratase large subunit